MVRKVLLVCGILFSPLYITINFEARAPGQKKTPLQVVNYYKFQSILLTKVFRKLSQPSMNISLVAILIAWLQSSVG